MSKKKPKDGPRRTKSDERGPHKQNKQNQHNKRESRKAGKKDKPRGAGERLDEASGEDPGPSPERRSTMQPDTPHPEGHQNLQDGAATIAPVTDAMMDHAAREAAALADGVAQGTVILQRAAAEQTEAAAERADALGRTAAEMSGHTAEAAEDVARTVVEATTRASDGALRTAEAAAQDAGRAASRAVERGTEAARDALSASADAVSQYNAKVMEIMRSNMASTTELFAALVQAKSVPEALSLNADHFRRSMEMLTSQGRELASLAQRIALDAMRPLKGAADR